MPPTEIRTRRERLGLTQGQAARLVGVDERSWRSWEAGHRNGRPCAAPGPAWRLLVLAEQPEVRAALEGWAQPEAQGLLDRLGAG